MATIVTALWQCVVASEANRYRLALPFALAHISVSNTHTPQLFCPGDHHLLLFTSNEFYCGFHDNFTSNLPTLLPYLTISAVSAYPATTSSSSWPNKSQSSWTPFPRKASSVINLNVNYWCTSAVVVHFLFYRSPLSDTNQSTSAAAAATTTTTTISAAD